MDWNSGDDSTELDVYWSDCVSSEIFVHRRPGPANSCTCTKCIPNASWHDFVEACLTESGAEVTGECTTWASGNDYGTMPNWDTSLVEDMSGYTGSVFQGFGYKSTFDGDISKWNTAQVTDMNYMFSSLLRSTKTLGVGTQRK